MATKTRVPVRGTIGKSVPINAATSLSGYATLAQVMTLLQSYTPVSSGVASTTVGGSGSGSSGVTSITSTTLTIAGTTSVPTVNLSGTQVSDIALGGTSLQAGSSPTLSGNWTFSPASGTTTFNGAFNADAFSCVGANSSGHSYGFSCLAGFTTEAAFYFATYGNTPILVGGANGVQIGSPTGGREGAGTLNVQNGIYNDGVLMVGLPASPVQGDIAYYNGSNWANLGPGTAGQILQTGGASANPSWVTNEGASVATPGTIPDLVLWWESDDILATAGSVVERLRERTPWVGGLAATNVNGTAANGVLVSSAQLNSLPVLAWPTTGGVNTTYIMPFALNIANNGGNGGATFFVVFNPGASGSVQAIVGGSSTSLALYLSTTSSGKALGLVKTATSTIGNCTSNWTAGTWYQANATYTAASGAYAFRQARTAAGSGTGATNAGAAITSWIGADDGTGTNPLQSGAQLAAIIIYNRVLTSTQITAVENYLNSKWGV